MNGKYVEVKDWGLVFGMTAGFAQWQCREPCPSWSGGPSRRALLHRVRIQSVDGGGN